MEAEAAEEVVVVEAVPLRKRFATRCRLRDRHKQRRVSLDPSGIPVLVDERVDADSLRTGILTCQYGRHLSRDARVRAMKAALMPHLSHHAINANQVAERHRASRHGL